MPSRIVSTILAVTWLSPQLYLTLYQPKSPLLLSPTHHIPQPAILQKKDTKNPKKNTKKNKKKQKQKIQKTRKKQITKNQQNNKMAQVPLTITTTH
jgi:hypothetical protein